MAEWKKIDDLFDYGKGTLQSSKCIPGKYDFITAAEEWKTHKSYTHDCEALIFAMAASGSLGRTHYVKGKFISSDLCFILTPKKGLKLDLLFYYRLFNFLRQDIVKKTATGTSKLAINQTNFGAYKLPYFDYDHQVSFRDRIESIAGINDELTVQTNDQLVLLKQLRQQVLQEAVEGHLTAGWRKKHPDLISGENHASKLLEKIKAEKERLVKEGKIRKEKPLPPITDKDLPRAKTNGKLFDLPDGWVWCRLGEICKKITDGTHRSPVNFEKGEYKYITAKNIKDFGIDLTEITFVTTAIHKEIYSRCDPEKGDILYIKDGATTGIATINNLDEQFSMLSSVALIKPLINNIFLVYVMRSPLFYESTRADMYGVAITRITLEKIINSKLPIAPIAEQQAIVGRVDNLMAMIDELEKYASGRKEQAAMLSQSVLREAFEGDAR